MSKEFDVIVFGATGFTGALVARYLLQDSEAAVGAPQAIKWAIAGRSEKKLEQTKQELKKRVPSVPAETVDAIPSVVADSSDDAQMVAMVQRTKVVLTLVGPYMLYGERLVKACAENGVHYCDLTGETLWIEKMMNKYAAAAEKSGAVILNCCGFESVPSDLSTFVITEAVHKHKQTETSKVTLCFRSMDGGVSGGTLASVFTILETSTNADLQRAQNPFFLTDAATQDEKKRSGVQRANAGSMLLKKETDLNFWSSYFIGGSVNSAIVHRSNYLLKGRYGDRFVYRERGAIGGFFAQLALTVGIAIGGVLLYFSWTRALVKMLAPKPGQGPSEAAMAKGHFVAKVVAYDAAGQLAARLTTVGKGDPGYMMTSQVIAECALCLAKGEFASSSVKGGFHTTASALGPRLVTRLQQKQIMKFNVELV
ncbi:hypothetical protein ATCC90586_009501 [Pythium insidiosum]|nr:hypothetical protein ATCC90586_009501 [Pythium insidiosum]